MMNQVLEKRMLMMIAQSYAFTYEELNEVYVEIQSFDKIMAIIEIAREHEGITLKNAYENWKTTV